MAKIVRRRRGSTEDHANFTGDPGEITVDLTEKTVRVHDGSIVSGVPLAKADMTNVSDSVGITQLAVSDGSAGQALSTNGAGQLSFTSQTDVSGSSIGGDLTGTIGNAQIVAGAVGTPELADNAVVSAKIGTGEVQQTHLANNSVGTAQIQLNAVTVNELGPMSVQEAKIQTGAVTNTKIADNAVTTVKILDANVTEPKIADNAVTTAKLADNAITTAKINNSAVTDAKIAGMTSNKLSGDLPALVGRNLTNLPYDVAFNAGFDKDSAAEDVVARTYAEIIMARTGVFVGESGSVDTAPSGSALILDVRKNGTTIYSTRPEFNGTTFSNGTISSGSFVPGDKITFRVTQIGSSTPGQGVRFTLRGEV